MHYRPLFLGAFRKPREFSVGALVILFLLTFVSIVPADEADYFYDDAGRLVRASRGAVGFTYQYDEVGNLLSISDPITIGNGSPVINLEGINPNVLFAGSTVPVTITGQNLFTMKTVTSDNSYLKIRTRGVTDTQIRADITVAQGGSGGATITVTTLYGSANVQVTLTSSQLTFSPQQLALTPGGSGIVTANVIPAIGSAITITIDNSNPSIASSPTTVLIPSGGATTFGINALNNGVATISSGSAKTVVFVTNAFAPLPGEEVTNKALPVSVHIDSPLGNSPITSFPVSVYVQAPVGNAETVSSPVSVAVSEALTNAITTSIPVSVLVSSP